MFKSSDIHKFFVFALLFVAFVSLVSAADFTLRFNATTDTILNNETAHYNVELTNYKSTSTRYQIYTISPYWDLNPSIVTVDSMSTGKFILDISPMRDILSGPQLVPVTFKTIGSDAIDNENLYVYIKSANGTPGVYVPNVAVSLNLKDQVDPREALSIDVHMLNRNPLDMKEITINVSSTLFNKEFKTSLGPLEEKTNQILFSDINPLQQPGTYVVDVSLIYQNKTIGQVEKEIQIQSYSNVAIEDLKNSGLFSSSEKISLTNNGNADATKLVKVDKNIIQKIFTKTSEKYVSMTDNGESFITWNVNLKPNEKHEITITTNYIILVIIIIIIIVGLISYFVFRSPVLLFKSSKIVSATEHGVSEIKVKLHIKNRSGATIRNLKIIDKFPKIVQLEEDLSLGTLKPTKMVSADKTHTLLMWNFDVLDPYEERLLTYKLKSSLNIVGNMTLPPAKVKFGTSTGERTYYSNDVELMHKSQNSLE